MAPDLVYVSAFAAMNLFKCIMVRKTDALSERMRKEEAPTGFPTELARLDSI